MELQSIIDQKCDILIILNNYNALILFGLYQKMSYILNTKVAILSIKDL